VTPIFSNSNMGSNLENMDGTPHSSHTCASFRVTHFWHTCAKSLHLIAETTGRGIIHMMSIFSYGSVVSFSRKFAYHYLYDVHSSTWQCGVKSGKNGYHTLLFTHLCLISSVIVSLLAPLCQISTSDCKDQQIWNYPRDSHFCQQQCGFKFGKYGWDPSLLTHFSASDCRDHRT